jgi:flagellar hook-associated protein 3 FlgL
MVTRVSTAGNYSAILANLMAAQARQSEAGDRVSTQKNGTDLKDYARKAETLTAMRTVDRRLTAYADQNGAIAAKLDIQDAALNQITDAAGQIRQAIADAIATDRADTLMQSLGSQMSNAVEGMNAQYDGKYLFAGGQINTKPVTATSMADLTSGPALATFFKNDDFKVQAKLDDATTVTTGVLADDLGTTMLGTLKAIQAFNDGGSGPLNGQLTDAQRTFLQGQLTTWDGIRNTLTQTTAQNGLVQNRVDDVKANLVTRQNTLTGMIGDITDADMAKAAGDLSAAQLAVQASAQVFVALQQSSLLNLLKQ